MFSSHASASHTLDSHLTHSSRHDKTRCHVREANYQPDSSHHASHGCRQGRKLRRAVRLGTRYTVNKLDRGDEAPKTITTINPWCAEAEAKTRLAHYHVHKAPRTRDAADCILRCRCGTCSLQLEELRFAAASRTQNSVVWGLSGCEVAHDQSRHAMVY
eukprot:764272-Hanusia_phi.AAC.4